MQAPRREGAAEALIGADLRVELPEALAGRVRDVLGHLFELPRLFAAPSAAATRPRSLAATVSVRAGHPGWELESDDRRVRAATEEELFLQLQELVIETAGAQENGLLFRGSIVSRGSQSLLIVGDLGSPHVLLAAALTALGFRLTSVGMAAFDGRRPAPLPLPLVFRLEPAELETLPGCLEEHLIRVSSDLFRPRCVTAAPDLTHVLFPEAHPGRPSLVRPISPTTARVRLCSALMVAPADASPFAAVGGVLHHTRGVHVGIGDLPQALNQLARLLPQWWIGEECP